jgi:hypothetical protein
VEKWLVKWQAASEQGSVSLEGEDMGQLKTIFKSFLSIEAQMIRARLLAAGFQATVVGEVASISTEGGAMATGGIRIQVPASQETEARQLVDDLLTNSSDSDA